MERWVSSPTSCSRQGQLCTQTRLLRFISALYISSSWCVLLWKYCLHLLSGPPRGGGELLVGTPKAISTPGSASPGFSASFNRVSAPVPEYLGGPPLNPLQFMSFLYWGAQPGTQYCRSSLRSAEWRGMITLLRLWLFFWSHSPGPYWLSLLPGCSAGSSSLPVCQPPWHLFS